MIPSLGSVRFMFGLDDPRGLFEPKRFHDSVTCSLYPLRMFSNHRCEEGKLPK